MAPQVLRFNGNLETESEDRPVGSFDIELGNVARKDIGGDRDDGHGEFNLISICEAQGS